MAGDDGMIKILWIETRDCVRFNLSSSICLQGDMRIGEWIAELHTNFGRRALIDRKYVFVPMTDGGVFLGKWDSRRKPER